MNEIVRSLIASIADPIERLGAYEEWQERAAIIQYDGNESREVAEERATQELRAKVEKLKERK